MSKTIITAHIIDQAVQLANMPLLASGSENVLQIRCDFCNLWEGYGKTAVFYRDKGKVYHIPLVGDVATVPWEVLTDEGHFYFGIMGVADNTRTTEVVRLNVSEGAITTATAEPEEPTPDIYQQLLSAYGALEAAIAAEAAARKQADATEKAERQAEIATERARINNMTTLQEGSTTGDAELADIRVDIYGNIHANAGEAVRAQTKGSADMVDTQTLTFTPGTILALGGKTMTSELWSVSNEINLLEGMSIYIKTKLFGSAEICFFDSDGKVLSTTTNPSGADNSTMYEFELDAPAGTAYVRFSCYTTHADKALFRIKNIAKAVKVLEGKLAPIEQTTAVTAASIKALEESLPFGNLIDDTAPLASGYIADATGKKTASTSWWCTDYVPLKPNTTYYFSGFWSDSLYAFYDKDKNHIARGTITITKKNTTSGHFTTNNDAVFIRMSANKQNIPGAYIYTEDKYVPYGYDFSNFVPAIEERLEVVEQMVGALAGKKVLVLGDSITDNTYRTPDTAAWNKWATVLSTSLGFELTNDSIHATGFIASPKADKSDNLVNRITAHTADEDYDLIVIFMGVNEHIQHNPLGDATSTDKDAYVIPAMRYCLDYLANTFPAAKICALLPLPYIGQGTTLVNYVDAMQGIYDEYGVPTLDLFRSGGFRPKNQIFREQFTMLASDGSGGMVNDGLHPNQAWDNNYLAPRIKNFLTSLF
jgi:lysophospholipase L1-like esterase